MKKTIMAKPDGSGRTWTERCRCGRIVEVDCTFAIAPSKTPKYTRSWYDQDGNLERVTGDGRPKPPNLGVKGCKQDEI